MSWESTSIIKVGASAAPQTFVAKLLNPDGTTNTDPLSGVVYATLGGGDYGWEVSLPDAFQNGYIVFTSSPGAKTYSTAVSQEAAAAAVSGSPITIVGPGKYVSQAYMELARGTDNIKVWSRKGGTSTTIDIDAVNFAIWKAESRMDDALRSRYIIPIVTISTADAMTLLRLAEPIASFELYRARGLKDRDPVGKLLKAEYDEAIEQLELYADLTNSRILQAPQVSGIVNRVAEGIMPSGASSLTTGTRSAIIL